MALPGSKHPLWLTSANGSQDKKDVPVYQWHDQFCYAIILVWQGMYNKLYMQDHTFCIYTITDLQSHQRYLRTALFYVTLTCVRIMP